MMTSHITQHHSRQGIFSRFCSFFSHADSTYVGNVPKWMTPQTSHLILILRSSHFDNSNQKIIITTCTSTQELCEKENIYAHKDHQL